MKRFLSDKLTRFDVYVWIVSILLTAAIFIAVFLDNQSNSLLLRIAYLSPADTSASANIWMADVGKTIQARQLTFSPFGITALSVSPNGEQLVFAERNGQDGLSDLKLLNLRNGTLEQLTNCTDSRCDRPTWSPDGRHIAYEVINFNSDMANLGLGSSPPRVWLIDLSTNPRTEFPLDADTQILSHSPVWSANGKKLAVFDPSKPGVWVHDLHEDTAILIPSRYGISGSLSPDGSQLLLPETDQDLNARYKILDLITKTETFLGDVTVPIHENLASWSPDGRYIAVTRRIMASDDNLGWGLYVVNLATRREQPLSVDPEYSVQFFSWNSIGSHLLIQRSKQATKAAISQTPLPEIWIYDFETETLARARTNAYSAYWVP